jgi:hypothetical protein
MSLLSGSDIEINAGGPLSVGDPIHAHFPEGSEIDESSDGIVVRDPGNPHPLFYRKASVNPSNPDGVSSRPDGTFVRDVIIMGEVGTF